MIDQLTRAQTTIPSRTLWRVGWRYLARHPWQSVLMVIGITLGVAVAVAVDLANTSASRAFDLGTAAITGKATHQIAGGPQGIDETVYVFLRAQGVTQSAPIVSEHVVSPELGHAPLQVLGIDPFAEAPFRTYLFQHGALPLGNLTSFFTQPNTVLISSGQAQRYALAIGDPLTLLIQNRRHTVTVGGLLEPADSLSARLLDGLILADIATVQELTGRLGRIDRIDLILPNTGSTAVSRIDALLPAGLHITPVAARSGAVEQMTAAFRTNLTALSLLAMLVGMFLIYNTMTFSVVQRRPLFGTLRCLGVTRSEVFALVVSEALIVGSIGAALGLGLGILLGQGTVRLITQTINDLYFVVNVRTVEIAPESLIKGLLLGIVATVLTAAPPAWEAASVPPRLALSRSGLEVKARQAVVLAGLGGLGLLAAGLALLNLPTRNLLISFAGTFAVVVGMAMLTPVTMTLLMRAAPALTGRAWGVLGRMAPRNVANSLSRTSVAIAALMIAISVSIGVSLMVGSFRYTVAAWLEQILQGDIYISAPVMTASQNPPPLDPAVLPLASQWPGVARVDLLRATTLESDSGPVQVIAVHNPDFARERTFLAADRPPSLLWEAMQEDAILVSEPLANRLLLPQEGGRITLLTDRGAQVFLVAGIYYDYSASQGIVAMSIDSYRRYWDDAALTALSLRLAPGADVDAVQRSLQQALSSVQTLAVRPNRALREEVLVVFDRTFAITGALQVLATFVAFIGVLSALLSLQLEKQRELGILRAIGLTTQQLWALVLLETGLMGAVAGLLAMPTGYAVSLILIYVINSRSFGWTLQMKVDPAPFLFALVVAVSAALLAGIYPAWRMTRMITAEAIRFE